jgi:EAL domain-containing protein (putative c-di-GMP-specific phosphodiesterase class I)
MAHGLHMDVVAEGVETEEQQRFLAWRRCDQAQGYFYGRPMPLEQLVSIYSAKLVDQPKSADDVQIAELTS